MRMQNTGVEFVTFDAQDVIATSLWAGQNLITTATVLNAYNKNATIKLGNIPATGASNAKDPSGDYPNRYFGYDLDLGTLSINKYYAADAYQENENTPPYSSLALVTINEGKENEFTGLYAASVQDILNWLTDNNLQ